MVKVKIFIFYIILVSTFNLSCAKKKATLEKKQEIKVPIIRGGETKDLVLLYHGGTHRLDYTEEQIIPYLYREKEGKKEWLFDGFLFIEFKDNRGYEYAKGYDQKPAGKSQWKWLLSRNFEKGKGVHALNSLLDKLSKAGEAPKRMRNVVLTLPDPIVGHKTWGDLNGRNLDFDLKADRIEACKWYVDYVIDEWKKQGFDQLNLEGLYWVAETQKDTRDILPEIGAYIKSKGYKFYWIPYMYADGAAEWKKAGFHFAFQQPNYFFSLDRPYSLLTKAVAMGKDYDMGLEMEFDFNVDKPDYQKRYYDYISAFEEGGVWKSKRVAYYEGGGAWLQMSKSKTKQKEMYDFLADIIVKRQNEMDLLSNK